MNPVLACGAASREEFARAVAALQDPVITVVAPMTVAAWAGGHDNQRGSSPFPYYRKSVHGTVVTTNLETGGTYTNVFTLNTRDHTIIDNGDGTITITDFASGTSRYYDAACNFVLKDPGQVRFAVDIDYNGTPVTRATTWRSPTRSGSCA